MIDLTDNNFHFCVNQKKSSNIIYIKTNKLNQEENNKNFIHRSQHNITLKELNYSHHVQ